MKGFSILVVDDDPDFLTGIIRNLKKKFGEMTILGASSGEEAVKALKQNHIGVMLSDYRMPGISGLELLPLSFKMNPDVCVIMLTGYGTIENAVKALKEGAWDFITKPVDRETLFHTVNKAVEHYSLSTENKRLTEMLKKIILNQPIQYESFEMKQLMDKVTAVATAEYTVLITGESGSGKEYVARLIHGASKRKDTACHALNCPAIPEPLLESELFGHVKGAFTGADRNREGFFLSADKGTLILDEIGDISHAMQAKLLKFLQDREVKPVGSNRSKKTDVRIIALTNQNLEKKIEDGSFREDLYYRLNVLSLSVPPLRQRKEDIPVLVREFILKTCDELDIEPMRVEPAVLTYLMRQPWSGNVRELQNYVRRLAVFSNGNLIDFHLVDLVEGKRDDYKRINPYGHKLYKDGKKEALDVFSKDYLAKLFESTRGNISETARISGLERASIQKIIKRLNIDMLKYRR